jgi:hypothetical protein
VAPHPVGRRLSCLVCIIGQYALEARPPLHQKANYREWVDPTMEAWLGNAVGKSWKSGGCLGYQTWLDLVLKVSARERRSCLWCADWANAPTRGQSICGRGFLR